MRVSRGDILQCLLGSLLILCLYHGGFHTRKTQPSTVLTGHGGNMHRLRALRLLLSVLHPQQLVVATDGADVLALRGPQHFIRAHFRLQVTSLPPLSPPS
jgi:hypothetical protein